MEGPGPASAEHATNHHAWDNALPGEIGGQDKLHWDSAYVKGGRRRSAGALRGGIFWALLSVLIPALIISALRTICRASVSASTNGMAGASTRRLSDNSRSSQEDRTISRLIEECAAMEADLGLPLVQESYPAQELDETEQVRRIAFSLYQESLAFEQQVLQSQPAVYGNASYLTPSPARMHFEHQHAQGAVPMTVPQYVDYGPQHVTTDLTASEFQPGVIPHEALASSPQPHSGVSLPRLPGTQPFSADSSPFLWSPQGAFASPQHSDSAPEPHAGRQSLVEAPLPVGLLTQTAALLPQNVARPSLGEKIYVGRPGEAYSLEPDSWLESVPVIGGSQEVQRQSQAVSLNFPSPGQAAPCSSAAYQFSAGAASSGDASWSTSTASPGGAGEASAATAEEDGAGGVSAAAGAAEAATAGLQPSWVFRHPFVQLPVLLEGVATPLIRLSPSNFETISTLSVHDTLLSLRYMFMRQALNDVEAGFLAGYVQQLAVASAARARAAKRMARAGHGVVNIGQQFLVLDAIVSAMYVLGESPPSCTWWKAFIECFDTGYRYSGPGHRTTESGIVNIDVANRMLACMSAYKAGKRPQLEEIIDLKLILFFSPHMPIRFKSAKWDPWRQDHLLFQKENPAVSEWLMKRLRTVS
ncbi:uncharacterized protein EMH_0086830 [Eimeria mitis]|uniref:Uncharacterized protein n=1 Tax=Eimeria mitis TaxID=44415 RepID=U6KLZ8_9EIME|nr:uncharacterized protein EMH_0086830 [Eimeria mitis]CDJ36473.1 hypothetical protein, conserved [Eimeria mitis]